MPSFSFEPSPKEPMYIPGRRRMCSSPSKCRIESSSYTELADFDADFFAEARAGELAAVRVRAVFSAGFEMEAETALSAARDAFLAAKRVFAAVKFDCPCVEVAAADVFSTVVTAASPDTDVRVAVRFVKEAEAAEGGTVAVPPAEERVFAADVSVSTADALNKVRRLIAVSTAADEDFTVPPAAAVVLPACNCVSVRTEGFAVSAAGIVFRFGFTLDFFSNMFFAAGLCCGVFEVSSPPMPYYTTEKEILSTADRLNRFSEI